MSATGATALVLRRRLDGIAELAEPIPDAAVVTMSALLSATVREWVLVHDRTLELAGHRFVIVGWADENPPGVIVEHACTCRALDDALGGLEDD